jgi:hypothetical protein
LRRVNFAARWQLYMLICYCILPVWFPSRFPQYPFAAPAIGKQQQSIP